VVATTHRDTVDVLEREPVKSFAFVSAKDAWRAVALLAMHGPAVKIVAGGTDLLPDLKSASDKFDAFIDISRAADLAGIALTDEGLRIGARTTHSDILRSPLIRELCPALLDAARTIGAVQTRNLGTIGGNLMTCVPSMDSGPVLLALNAWVTIAGPEGQRRLPLSDLFVGPRKTSLRFDQLLVDIVIPKESLGKPADNARHAEHRGPHRGELRSDRSVRSQRRRRADVGSDGGSDCECDL
jgi:carbon-monoxide dehydrogenase medium subunit